MTNLTAALEAHKPALEARFVALTKWSFDNLVRQFGPAMRGVYNSNQLRNWGAIRCMTRCLGDRIDSEYELVDALVADRAKIFADATVAQWEDKINSKLGELDNAEVKALDGCRFNIVGTKDGRHVCIEQDMIVNVSGNGTLFNQFPSRIYVNGKFISAAKYKAL